MENMLLRDGFSFKLTFEERISKDTKKAQHKQKYNLESDLTVLFEC